MLLCLRANRNSFRARSRIRGSYNDRGICCVDTGFPNRRRTGWLSRIYVSVIGGNQSEQFRCCFAMGKIRGTSCMRSHIFVHRATTKYFSNSFVFKTEIEKEGLPGDITPALGAGGPRFKSGRPDHIFQRVVDVHFHLSHCTVAEIVEGCRLFSIASTMPANLKVSSFPAANRFCSSAGCTYRIVI